MIGVLVALAAVVVLIGVLHVAQERIEAACYRAHEED